MTNSVMVELNMKGHGGKIGFAKTNICHVVTGTLYILYCMVYILYYIHILFIFCGMELLWDAIHHIYIWLNRCKGNVVLPNFLVHF